MRLDRALSRVAATIQCGNESISTNVEIGAIRGRPEGPLCALLAQHQAAKKIKGARR